MSKLFPSGLALGDAFYDRESQRRKLKQHIDHTIHTVLIAPRRFGKTSLIKKVLDEQGILHIWLDFMAITSTHEAQTRFLNHISQLVVQLANTETRLKKLAQHYFQRFHPEITLAIPSILKLHFKPDPSPQIGITEALLQLDQVAQQNNKQLAIVCDEFQEIVNIDKDNTLQASIRHAVERAQNITYLFSGSKHQPLRRLFNGKQNPLYELCDQMTLERITAADYRIYLQAEAHKKWGQPLHEAILTKIFSYTDYYPKYVNALCAKLWFSEQLPTTALVDQVWQEYMFVRKAGIVTELNDLTLNQKQLLHHLCFHPTATPFSHQTSVSANLSVSAIQVALPVLIDKDLVVAVENVYRVLDPTFKYYFMMF